MSTNAHELVTELPGGGRLPMLGLGTWQLRGKSARAAVEWALEAGYRHFDTATAYGNQADIGAVIANIPRQDVFLTTKLPPDHAGSERRTLEESLRALGVDYLDLWLIHWPPRGLAGVPSWREFIRARDAGLVKDIGVSNYSPEQLDELTKVTGVTPAVNQIPWSPFRHDPALLGAHRERSVVLEGYSPFRRIKINHSVLVRIAKARGKTPAQVILRWHLEHDIVVIPKSARQDRIQSNADIFDFTLPPDDIAAIDALGTH